MIELTKKQVQDLAQTGSIPIRMVNPETQQRFVLVPENEYERLTDYDASPWTDEERDLLRAEALDALGWDGMESYQDNQP